MGDERAGTGQPRLAPLGPAAGLDSSAPRLELPFGDFRGDVPGIVFGVAQRGEWLHRGASGLANVEHGVPLTPATVMPIASVTKHFACAVALHLAAEGRLSLEDPIGRWIPELGGLQARPTLRQLMTHTSGLRCFLDLAILNGVRTVPADFPLAAQARQQAVNFPPGETFLYGNGGYYLLSLALERAGGRTFAELVGDRCLAPAGMNSTSAPRHPWPVRPQVATQYAPCEGGWRHVPPLLEEHLGDGSMVSTVDDLFAWLRYLRATTGPASLDALTAPTRLANGDYSRYGLGLITEHWRGVRLVHHSGLLLGASCTLLTVPEHELDVFVACNRPAALRAAVLGIVEAVLGERLEPKRAAPRADAHGGLLGRYLSADHGAIAEFSSVRGNLCFALFDAPATPLEADPPQPGVWPFHIPGYAGPLRFAATGPDAFDVLDAGATRRFQRIRERVPDAAGMPEGAEGEFVSEEAAATLRIESGPEGLRVHTRGDYGRCEFSAAAVAPQLLRLTPVGYDVTWLARLERSGGCVERVVLSSARTRHLPFTRRPG